MCDFLFALFGDVVLDGSVLCYVQCFYAYCCMGFIYMVL